VKTTRQHELYLGRPFLDGISFRLPSLVVLFEVVREVSVQVEAARVVPALATVALTLACHLETVWIHRRQHVDARVVQKPSDVWINRITVHQILLGTNRIFILNFRITQLFIIVA